MTQNDNEDDIVDDLEGLLSEADHPDLAAAWGTWCDRLKVLGQSVVTSDLYANDSRTQSEGFRAVARQLIFALQSELEASNPYHPEFIRYQNPWSQWGGPAPDNVYLRARIDPAATYRIWGDVEGVSNLILSQQEGDMHMDEFGIFNERTLDHLTVRDGRLDIIVSPERTPDCAHNWIPLHNRARLLSLRIIVADWQNDVIPTIHIERQGAEGVPPGPPSPTSVARALDRSASWLERSLPFWATYVRQAMASATPNTVSPPRKVPGSARHLSYGSGVWDLGSEGALIITTEAPDADYWGWSIHTEPWFESGDWPNRQTSLSGDQLHVDSDGLVRIVLSQRDPGVPNWLDSEARPRGLIFYRLIHAQHDITPHAEVVPMGEVLSLMPADHPRISPPERREQLRRRRESAARRR